MKILIDNGHGINTPGKCSPDGSLHEWKWAREIARRITEELTAKGYDAELLTPEDKDTSISVRVLRANQHCKKHGAKNVLLVSIHNNAGNNSDPKSLVEKDKLGWWKTATGFSVFCSKNASSQSKHLASMMTRFAIDNDMTGNRSIPRGGYWTWSWTDKDIGILKGSNCPAVLTENFFMDNKDDLEYLLSDEGKNEIIKLHIECIIKYIKELQS